MTVHAPALTTAQRHRLAEDPRACATLTVVLFGATGDLARRKLLPALGSLAADRGAERRIRLIGVGRSPLTGEVFETMVGDHDGRVAAMEVEYVRGGYDDPSTYAQIAHFLGTGTMTGDEGMVLFYVATPPEAFGSIIDGLGTIRGAITAAGRRCRVLIEKPFGENLASAEKLFRAVVRNFEEEELLLVDHYVAKPALHALEEVRVGSGTLDARWHSASIDHIQVTVAETLGVEARGGFYERSGALRDIVQNHGLQLLAAVLSERPRSAESAGEARARRLRALNQLTLDATPAGTIAAVRGQYGPAPGSMSRAYVDEEGVREDSRTETFAAVKLRSSDPRWAGVPIYLRAGKRLAETLCEIRIAFRSGAGHPPAVLRGDKNFIRLNVKEPPFIQISDGDPESCLTPAAPGSPSSDYERIFRSAMTGGGSIFPSPAEVLRSWQIVDPLIRAWRADTSPVEVYPAGGWGPASADLLVAAAGHAWMR